jgi:transposase
MTIVANTFAYVIGADTHSRTHTLAVLDARTGARVDTRTFPTTPAGLSRAVAWIARRTSGLADVLVTIEGVGSYGARLARACQDAGYRVVESFPTAARERRGRGKSDEIDAELIARSVLGVDADGVASALPVLKSRSLETAAQFGSTVEARETQSIAFPQGIYPDAGNVSVTLSPPVLGAVEGREQ